MARITKKVGLKITDYFHVGSQIEIETDEDLQNVEKFINNTGVVNSLGMFKNKLFGPKVEKNTIDFLSGTHKKISDSGFEGERKELPTRVGVKLLEGASLEDDEKLQNIWSNMLANAVTGKVDVRSSYISILSELTYDEIKFLNLMHEVSKNNKKTWTSCKMKTEGFKKYGLMKNLSIDEDKFELIVDNLLRLNLVYTSNGTDKQDIDDTYTAAHMKRGMICFTFLGYAFVEACKFKTI